MMRSGAAGARRGRVMRRAIAMRGALLMGAVALLVAASSSSAWAAAAWRISSLANTSVAPSGVITYYVIVTNAGDVAAPATTGGDANNCVQGSPSPSDPSKCIVVRGDFPSGLTPLQANTLGGPNCSVQGASIVCPYSGSDPSTQFATAGGGATRTIIFTAQVNPGATGTITSSFQVSGGGASNVGSTVDPTLISATPLGFGIDQFDAQVSADAAGDPLTQAGGHPFDATTAITFNTTHDSSSLGGDLYPLGSPKDITVDLPPGFIGNPTVVDQCSADQLANGGLLPLSLCPPSSQVGTALVSLSNAGIGGILGPLPVFNLVPPPNAPARLGFNVSGTIVTLDATLHPDGRGNYQLSARVSDVSELRIQGTQLTLWGVPSDPVHDPERACPGVDVPANSGISCPSGTPRQAFLRNPTSCTAPGVGLPTTLSVDTWENPSAPPVTKTVFSHLPPGFPAPESDWGPQQGTTGCDLLPFTPSFSGGPQVGSQAGAPAGFGFDLRLPQSNDPDTLAEADLKKAVVTLPQGVRVSPSSADGLQGCSSSQIALGSEAAPTCPDGSKVGTATINTPLLAQPLSGSIYLASPFDNPFDSLVAIYLVASGQGVTIKLPGQVQMDQSTGQITTTVDNNPQAPFTNVHLQFDGGPRAALALPDQCGTYTTNAVLTAWSGAVVPSNSTFTVGQDENGQGCPPHFAPSLSAGTQSNTAGHSSSFVVHITRGDLDQELSTITVQTPSGVTGRIANVPLCAAAAAGAGTCPESSRIGDVITGAGAGTNPFFITNGRAYLTGPYKGAPFGLSIVVPAVAGPFNLGNVVVRSAIFVDKHTADLRVATDPLPTILQGIPLDVRDVRVDIDRSGFFLNATSCAAKQITANFQSTAGWKTSASTRYQASDCASLGFKPRMVLTVGSKGHTANGKTTPFSTTLTMPSSNQSNLRWVRVTLPSTLNARLTVINRACTRAQFESNIRLCAHAKAGTATAVTPLLRSALHGGVYFVKNGHPLPDLFVALRGQVAFDLIGRITIPGGKRLATTFQAAPDVPVRSFTLKLSGSASSASVGTLANLCTAKARKAKAAIDYIAQNGRVLQVSEAPRVSGCPKPKRRR